MPNPKLDVREVVRAFPGRVESKPGFPVFNLFSPLDVALRENQLRLAEAELDLGPRVPAHYLLYAQREPETREQSRIGGLPYRPRDLAWPTDSYGRPKEFVCQIDFSDSSSVLPELPGQVMLLFASEEGGEAPFTLEWYSLGLKDLVSTSQLPRFDFAFPMLQRESVSCYLYQTYDYPEAETRIKGTKFESWKSFGVPCGSKIAGFNKSTTAGDLHLFTLESIRFVFGEPYPFVAQGGWKPSFVLDRLLWRLAGTYRKLRGVRNRCYDLLMIGDMGRIHVLKEANGKLQVTDESY